MKKQTTLVIFLILTMSANICFANNFVDGYTKKDGTYVQGHFKSEPDQYRHNNQQSQSYGGKQRDEFSSGTGATNKSNPSYNYRDNDRDGVYNPYDAKPNKKSSW